MSPETIMIAAGEASGDMHGARLLQEMVCLRPGISATGLCGPELVRAGMEQLVDASKVAVVGIVEVVSHLPEIRAAMDTLTRRLQQGDIRLLILIDFPDFNLRLAKKAKQLGVPIFYYISPQLWAWRSGRVHTIRRLVDRMAVILPFEKAFYAGFGMEVEYVGHPLVDRVAVRVPLAKWRQEHAVAKESHVVGLLPGSRTKEIRTLLPIFLHTARALVREGKRKGRNYLFVLPVAATVSHADLAAGGFSPDDPDLAILLVRDNRYDAMAACDAALAASGTVALELALLGIPMAIAYKVSSITALLVRWLAQVAHVSLVNLIAGREIVPEFLQDDVEPRKMASALEQMLHDERTRSMMRSSLAQVRTMLGSAGASKRAAAAALKTMGAAIH